MSKVQVGFKFSPEVDARLKELARIWGQTRTAWLEEQILSFDLDDEREAAAGGVTPASIQGKAIDPEILPIPVGRIDTDRIAAAQDWLKKPGRKK